MHNSHLKLYIFLKNTVKRTVTLTGNHVNFADYYAHACGDLDSSVMPRSRFCKLYVNGWSHSQAEILNKIQFCKRLFVTLFFIFGGKFIYYLQNISKYLVYKIESVGSKILEFPHIYNSRKTRKATTKIWCVSGYNSKVYAQ